MSSHLNLVGSIFIAGLIFLAINRFHASVNQTSNEKMLDSITSQTCASISRLIEFDFNRMGYGVPPGVNALVLANSNRISFLSDIDENGTIDTVRYYISPTNAASSTTNPNDVILYRRVNYELERDAPLGVTQFILRYFNAVGTEITDVTQIKTFEIALTVESTAPYGDRYSSITWQTRISPPNILRD